jgi:ribosome maturation protein Sdo1
MKLEELTYTPSDIKTSAEHPHTIVLLVDEEMYDRYQKDKSIPIAQVVDSFEVFRYEHPGKSGKLAKPSKQDLTDVFGFTNDDKIAAFMLEHGKRSGGKLMQGRKQEDLHAKTYT